MEGGAVDAFVDRFGPGAGLLEVVVFGDVGPGAISPSPLCPDSMVVVTSSAMSSDQNDILLPSTVTWVSSLPSTL
jgi:hypothetical protein